MDRTARHPPGPGWVAAASSVQGPVRARHDDAYSIRLGPPWAPTGFGIFDGVGSDPMGGEAARAAAQAFEAALDAGVPPEGLLQHVNEEVMRSGGATTGVMAVWPGAGPPTIVSAGDSSAYVLDAAGKLRALVPHDAVGPYQLTDFFGNARLAGHVKRLPPTAARGLLLCTDGVDAVVEPAHIVAALAHIHRDPAAVVEAVRSLIAEVVNAGAPDNASVVLAVRRDDGR